MIQHVQSNMFLSTSKFFSEKSGVWIALLLPQPGIRPGWGASFVDMYRTENVLKNPICKRDWRPVLWLQYIYIYNIYFQLFHVWLMESRNHHLRLVRRWRWMMWDSPGEVAKWITYNFITFMTFDDRSARVVSCLQCRSVRYTDFQTCQNWPIAWLLRELPDIPAEFLQKLQVLVAQRRLQSTEAELETAFCGDLKQLKKEGDFLGQVMEPRHWANLGSSASCCWGDVL